MKRYAQELNNIDFWGQKIRVTSMATSTLSKKIIDALESIPDGKLLESSKSNIRDWAGGGFLPEWALQSLLELFEMEAYDELNDRFFKLLEFATAGMRGRTLGRVAAKSELGEISKQGTPAHAAIGSNNMNDFTVARATIGLFTYCKKWSDENNLDAPSLIIAYDVRHFSRHFGELTASIWTSLGGKVKIFDGPRSVPQLSFTLIKEKATAGVVITASHNPAVDNGYKVYFSDGAQVISPHAEGIIDCVNSTNWANVAKHLSVDLSKVELVSKGLEDVYAASIDDCVIDKNVMRANKPKVVYSSIHGTGAVMCPQVMRRHGLDPILVEEQMIFDPRFPTVKQPNPEYTETMAMAVALANDVKADCVMATDPDSDRMGVAFRAKDDSMQLLTGNMIGSLLMDYRISRMIETGLVTNPKNCAVVKTFVTSPLQDAIAASYGVKCINALTGFKWVGARIREYQETLEAKNPGLDYWSLSYKERAALLQKDSTLFLFGNEESYGYLGLDCVRDKDANSAVIMFCEMFAYLTSQGKSVDQYLDEIYLRCGYFLEDLKSIYKEGASGAEYIKNFLAKIEKEPIERVGNVKVASVMNFEKDEIRDADGHLVPKEKFFFYKLENGYSFAIRASGTEPKIKFYAFAREMPSDASQLDKAKADARKNLTETLNSLEAIFNQE